MKTTTILLCVATALCLMPTALGQNVMDEAKTRDILDQLTRTGRNTWISTGTIQATHYEEAGPRTADATVVEAAIVQAVSEAEATPSLKDTYEDPQKLEVEAAAFNAEYALTNSYTMTTQETVKYDGQRFHWEVILTDRSDSMPLGSGLEDNYMARHFKTHELWNKHRIFAWDGSEYTSYSVDGGRATVDTTGALGQSVNGPLTAGLIPWGYGKFSAANLAAAAVSASENGTSSIQMQIKFQDDPDNILLAELELDPLKDYAVTRATLTNENNMVITYTCSGYDNKSGRWIPTTVEIARQVPGIDSAAATLERWTDIQVTDTATPSLSDFDVAVGADATIEYLSSVSESPLTYINSYDVDTDKLLLERLDCEAVKRVRPQNCATVALRHVASEFGKSVSSGALSSLVGATGGTNLRDLKQAARNLGLYASVVKTDLAALRNLGQTQAILYLPGKNHFVVVDRVDSRYIWLIDLSANQFYYRESVYLFPTAWSTGTALLVSDRPLLDQLSEIPDADAEKITAGYWLCNTLYQESDSVYCDYVPGEVCDGCFQYYYERYVCGLVYSGTCTTKSMIRMQETPCVVDLIYECTVTGSWTYYYMRACEQ